MAKRFLYLGLFLLLIPVIGFYLYGFIPYTELSRGAFNALGDEILGLWVFDRLSFNLISGYSLFDGGVFFPNQNSLAFLESMPLLAVFYRCLLGFFSDDKFLAYHVLVLSLLSANFVSMLYFCRHFLSTGAALVSASLFAFAQLRLAQFSHIQLLPQFPYPLIGLFILRYQTTHQFKFLAGVSFLIIIQMLCSIHLGFLLLVSLTPLGVLAYFVKDYKVPRKHLYYAGITLFVGLFPYAAPYYWVSHQYGIVRRIGEATDAAAKVFSYFAVHPDNIHYFWTQHLPQSIMMHEKRMWIGAIGFCLGVFGFFSKEIPELTKRALNITTVFVIWMSFGPKLLLYSIFYYVFPGMKSIRVPSRFGLIYLFIMALFAGIGFEKLQKKLRWPSTVFALLLCAIILFENRLPIRLVEFPPYLKEASQFLAQMDTKDALIHLPLQDPYPVFPGDEGNPTNNREAVRMVYSLYHRHPIFNGYAGFEPQNYRHYKTLEVIRDPGRLAYLKSQGIRLVVLEKNHLSPDWLPLFEGKNTLYSDQNCSIYDLAQF